MLLKFFDQIARSTAIICSSNQLVTRLQLHAPLCPLAASDGDMVMLLKTLEFRSFHNDHATSSVSVSKPCRNVRSPDRHALMQPPLLVSDDDLDSRQPPRRVWATSRRKAHGNRELAMRLVRRCPNVPSPCNQNAARRPQSRQTEVVETHKAQLYVSRAC